MRTVWCTLSSALGFICACAKYFLPLHLAFCRDLGNKVWGQVIIWNFLQYMVNWRVWLVNDHLSCMFYETKILQSRSPHPTVWIQLHWVCLWRDPFYRPCWGCGGHLRPVGTWEVHWNTTCSFEVSIRSIVHQHIRPLLCRYITLWYWFTFLVL